MLSNSYMILGFFCFSFYLAGSRLTYGCTAGRDKQITPKQELLTDKGIIGQR